MSYFCFSSIYEDISSFDRFISEFLSVFISCYSSCKIMIPDFLFICW
nr:MAG TPA: hypothetical protein [Caudoviricetes sp.]DAU00946.1 MAG TPA: hypothetical protein [Caudoviricetes sp.]